MYFDFKIFHTGTNVYQMETCRFDLRVRELNFSLWVCWQSHITESVDWNWLVNWYVDSDWHFLFSECSSYNKNSIFISSYFAL